MSIRVVSGGSNVVPFPERHAPCPIVEAVAELAPSRSLVDTLLAERGEAPHDVWGGFAREFAYQARALEAGEGRDAAIVRLRGLVDAHIGHAAELCHRYRETADALVTMEVRIAQGERVAPGERRQLEAARTNLRGRAIAALDQGNEVGLGAAGAAATGCGAAAQSGHKSPDWQGVAMLSREVGDLGHGAAAAFAAADGEIPAVEFAETGERDRGSDIAALGHEPSLGVLSSFWESPLERAERRVVSRRASGRR